MVAREIRARSSRTLSAMKHVAPPLPHPCLAMLPDWLRIRLAAFALWSLAIGEIIRRRGKAASRMAVVRQWLLEQRN